MSATSTSRRRIPAEERRVELIDAAVVEFAHGGLHGTPVDRIARRVGVAQPYVFSLFGSKRELFLAAVERAFGSVAETFSRAAAEYRAAPSPAQEDVLQAMGQAYVEMLGERREVLMLQHQAYAACDEPEIRVRVRGLYADLVARAKELSDADTERLDEFFRYGMWLNVAAALGVEDLSVGCEWMVEERAGGQ
jgi:AcrR family transcriptional regulator